jgi:hypothetical protein
MLNVICDGNVTKFNGLFTPSLVDESLKHRLGIRGVYMEQRFRVAIVAQFVLLSQSVLERHDVISVTNYLLHVAKSDSDRVKYLLRVATQMDDKTKLLVFDERIRYNDYSTKTLSGNQLQRTVYLPENFKVHVGNTGDDNFKIGIVNVRITYERSTSTPIELKYIEHKCAYKEKKVKGLTSSYVVIGITIPRNVSRIRLDEIHFNGEINLLDTTKTTLEIGTQLLSNDILIIHAFTSHDIYGSQESKLLAKTLRNELALNELSKPFIGYLVTILSRDRS